MYFIKNYLIFLIIIFFFLIYNKYFYFERFTGYTKKYNKIGSSPYLSENDFYKNSINIKDFDIFNDKQYLYNPNLVNRPFNQNSKKRWKNEFAAYNDEFYQRIPIKNDLLKLPKSLDFQNNSYRLGFIKYIEIIKSLNDNINNLKIDNNFYDANINEVQLDNLNSKTWLNRWIEYNPNVLKKFKYIKSPIENVNKLNLLFLKKVNENQTMIMDNNYLIKYGIINFELLVYKINSVSINKDNIVKYDMLILLFREQDLYLPTFFYKGFVINNKAYIEKIDIVGYYTTDNVLLPDGVNNILENGPYNFFILNEKLLRSNNLRDSIISKNIFNLNQERRNYLNQFKLVNNYACFNINQNLHDFNKDNDKDLLTYLNRHDCESSYNWYNNRKEVGIWDKPCKKDDDCIFFKLNKNYENSYGKCMNDGYCELPLDMLSLGYRYYRNQESNKPLCYNCKTNAWNPLTELYPCCDEQFNKKKYPFLNGPDYAFKNDFRDRLNSFQQKNFKKNN